MQSRFAVPLVLALLSLVLLLSSPTPVSSVVCGGSGYDLSSITFSDLLYNDTVKYLYVFRPCSNVTYSACQSLEGTTSGGTMLCQWNYLGNPATSTYSLATWVPESTQALTTWTPYGGGGGGGNGNNRGVRMFLQDGALCGTTPRALTVSFQCNASMAAGIAAMTFFNETSMCNYAATVQTSATCTGPNANANGQVACGTNGLNLAPITTTDLIWKSTATNYTYYFRPCGVVTSAQCANNPFGSVSGEAMMCQATGLNNELSPNTYDIAWYNPQLTTWRPFSYQGQASGWEMSIADGTSCPNGNNRALQVYWMCQATATTPIFLYLNETSECNYQAVVLTSLACATANISTSLVSCGGAYDLSFASQKDLIYNVPGSTEYIVFRPCGVVDNAVCQAQPNTNSSMVCQAYQGSPLTNDIAIYNPTLVTYQPTLSGIQMYIQDGDVCGTLGQRSLTVNFNCQQGGPAQALTFANFQEPSTCQYVITINTPAVCRTGRQNGFCGSANYDFSLSGTSDYAFTTPNGAYTYYFQPCGQVQSAQCNANNNTASSMMCQAVMGSSQTYDLAFYDSQLVSWYRLANGNGWQMFVQDGASCGGAGYERALTVNFLCTTGPAMMTNVSEVSTCNYVAYVYTPQACAPVSNGGATGLNLDALSSSGGVGQPLAYETVSKCGGIYNLLPLSTTDLTYSDWQYNWVFRPCGALNTNKNCTAGAASTPGGWMLCQDSKLGYGAYEGSSYNQYSVSWTPLGNNQGGGVLMQQTDGALCGTLGNRVTRAFFRCNATATTAVMYNVTEGPTCTYNLYIWTSLACPTPATTCGGGGYNITSLTARSDLSVTSGGYTYYFAPCGVVQSSQCQANVLTQSAMLCQASTTSNSTYNLAVYAPQAITWSTYGGSGVQMTVQDGSTCDNYDFERVTTVVFLCGLGGGGAQLLNVSEATTCNYVAFVNTGMPCASLIAGGGASPTASPTAAATAAAAPSTAAAPPTSGGGGGSSGLSGGAIAGIVIGSIVGALILLGLLLLACCGGAGFGRKKGSSADAAPEGPKTTGRYGEMGETEPSQSAVEMETTDHSPHNAESVDA